MPPQIGNDAHQNGIALYFQAIAGYHLRRTIRTEELALP